MEGNSMNIGKEIAILKNMTVTDLRTKYVEVFGEETRCRNKEYLWKRIAWRLQSQVEGDLSERSRKRAEELANDADIRMTAPKTSSNAASERTRVTELHIPQDKRIPMPGTVIVREYKGRVLTVTVLPKGFEYEGEVYRSLSAVAKEATGTHWNGYHFFNLLKEANAYV
jgi:hypothetical protein